MRLCGVFSSPCLLGGLCGILGAGFRQCTLQNDIIWLCFLPPPLLLRNNSEILMSRSSACSHDKLLENCVFLVCCDKEISLAIFPFFINFCWRKSLRIEQHHASDQCRCDPGADKAVQSFLFLLEINKVHDSRASG